MPATVGHQTVGNNSRSLKQRPLPGDRMSPSAGRQNVVKRQDVASIAVHERSCSSPTKSLPRDFQSLSRST